MLFSPWRQKKSVWEEIVRLVHQTCGKTYSQKFFDGIIFFGLKSTWRQPAIIVITEEHPKVYDSFTFDPDPTLRHFGVWSHILSFSIGWIWVIRWKMLVYLFILSISWSNSTPAWLSICHHIWSSVFQNHLHEATKNICDDNQITMAERQSVYH